VTTGVGENRRVPGRHPMLTYTLLRVLVFAVPFAVLVLLRVPFIWALVAAGFASGIVSIFLLSRQRDAVSAAITTRSERATARLAERTAAEDAWDDAQRAQRPDTSTEGETGPQQ